VGRPTVMTPEVISKLEEAFAWGCTDIEACLHADIATPTLYLYQEKNPKFIERKHALKENPVLLARSTVVNAMVDDPDLALKYLERKKKGEFSLRSELTGKDGKDLPTPILGGAAKGVHTDDSNSQAIETTQEN
jgi:hypothetical protein